MNISCFIFSEENDLSYVDHLKKSDKYVKYTNIVQNWKTKEL